MSGPLVAALSLLVAALLFMALCLTGTLIAAETWHLPRRRPRPQREGRRPDQPRERSVSASIRRSDSSGPRQHGSGVATTSDGHSA